MSEGITNLIKAGWELYGNPGMQMLGSEGQISLLYFQAMIKRSK